jgi:hypothetical protein
VTEQLFRGPRLSLSYPLPVSVLQMSLQAIVTTTPTPVTTPCLSALLILNPPTRSVPGEGICCRGMGTDLVLCKALSLCVFFLWHRPPQVPGSQLFASLQVPDRPGGAHGHDNHATLPADWKHRREPPPGPLDRGRCLKTKAPGDSGCVQPSLLLHLRVCVEKETQVQF